MKLTFTDPPEPFRVVAYLEPPLTDYYDSPLAVHTTDEGGPYIRVRREAGEAHLAVHGDRFEELSDETQSTTEDEPSAEEGDVADE